jgi:PKD repeat protein
MNLRLVISLMICLSIFATPVLAEETPFTVDFSANVTTGTAPLPVLFTNLVTGNQVSGFWIINNETITQLAGPEYIFTQPGHYNISLTVTDDTNTTLTETKLDYIIVNSSISTTAISFISSGSWGSNPVIITDKSSGEIVFVGKTSSKNIMLESDSEYTVQVEPGGITDTMNSPDYGLYQLQDWAKKNIIGIIIAGAFVFTVIGLFFRRK